MDGEHGRRKVRKDGYPWGSLSGRVEYNAEVARAASGTETRVTVEPIAGDVNGPRPRGAW